MTNKLDEKAIAITFAIVITIIYIACFLIVLIAGESALKFFQLFFHGIDITGLGAELDITKGIAGLIVTIITSYIVGWLFATIYNKYAK